MSPAKKPVDAVKFADMLLERNVPSSALGAGRSLIDVSPVTEHTKPNGTSFLKSKKGKKMKIFQWLKP
jgi:hypothetical protein